MALNNIYIYIILGVLNVKIFKQKYKKISTYNSKKVNKYYMFTKN